MLLLLFVSVTSAAGFDQTLLEEQALGWAARIYELYAEERFPEVYAHMTFEIKDRVTEEDYTEYQEYHFRRLHLRITEITVKEASVNPSLPRSLLELVETDSYDAVVGVVVQYKVSFLVFGLRHEETVDKDVFFLVNEDSDGILQWYLLWDPSSMEEDAPNVEE